MEHSYRDRCENELQFDILVFSYVSYSTSLVEVNVNGKIEAAVCLITHMCAIYILLLNSSYITGGLTFNYYLDVKSLNL